LKLLGALCFLGPAAQSGRPQTIQNADRAEDPELFSRKLCGLGELGV
jgi:hypothetical protein